MLELCAPLYMNIVYENLWTNECLVSSGPARTRTWPPTLTPFKPNRLEENNRPIKSARKPIASFRARVKQPTAKKNYLYFARRSIYMSSLEKRKVAIFPRLRVVGKTQVETRHLRVSELIMGIIKISALVKCFAVGKYHPCWQEYRTLKVKY